MKGKLHYCEFIHHNSNSHQLAVKTQWQTSFVMLPWRRASICNRDNSWGMKALRRGRVTSGIKITDNSNQSKSNFLSCYQPESLPRKQKTKQNKLKKNSNPNNIPFRNKTTVVTRKPGKTHTYTFSYMHKSQVCVRVSWTIWIQAMSDPDSRMSYYRDKHTHTHTRLKVSHRPQTGDGRRVRALIREQAVVIGGPGDWATGFDPAG